MPSAICRIEPVGSAADPADRKDAGGGQRLVDFGEQSGQIGLLADVVGTFGDKMRHGAPYACAGSGNTALTSPVPELANSSVINSTLPSYLSQPSRPSSITVSCMLPSP